MRKQKSTYSKELPDINKKTHLQNTRIKTTITFLSHFLDYTNKNKINLSKQNSTDTRLIRAEFYDYTGQVNRG